MIAFRNCRTVSVAYNDDGEISIAQKNVFGVMQLVVVPPDRVSALISALNVVMREDPPRRGFGGRGKKKVEDK